MQPVQQKTKQQNIKMITADMLGAAPAVPETAWSRLASNVFDLLKPHSEEIIKTLLQTVQVKNAATIKQIQNSEDETEGDSEYVSGSLMYIDTPLEDGRKY